MGYGAVVRNHDGLVMTAGMAQGVFSDDVDLAEAEALCFGLEMAKEIGLSPLIIESDSLRVTQFVSDRLSTSCFGSFLKQRTYFLQSTNFPPHLCCYL